MSEFTATETRIIESRLRFLLDKNGTFIGTLASYLKLVKADDWLPTCAVDGKNFYYNTEFVSGLTNEELDFVVAHEVFHIAYDHINRAEGRDKGLWNMATDYLINYTVDEMKWGKMPTKLPIPSKFKQDNGEKKSKKGSNEPTLCYDKKYTSKMSADEIYKKLEKEAQKNPSFTISQPLDMHLDPDDCDGDGGDGSGENKTKGQGRPTKKELEENRKEGFENFINSIATAPDESLPEPIKRLYSEYTRPVLDWRDIVRESVKSSMTNDYTYRRVSRRQYGEETAILQGREYDDMISICAAIDTSGSMSQEMLTDIISELRSIASDFNEWKLEVWCFDTSIHNHKVFTHNDQEINYTLAGGGGTTFNINWDFMKEKEIMPKPLVFFSDMYSFDGWGDEDYCETVWVQLNDDRSIVPSHGKKLYYYDAKKAKQ